jgi:protein-disulfide isomerase
LARQLVSGSGLPTAGDPAGAITVAEFFDYRCPTCRMMQPRLEALIAQDKRVRLVFKEWPIMGGVSVTAARLTLAAQWQGKYLLAHNTLITLPLGTDEQTARSALAAAGIDMSQLARDLAAHDQDIEAQLRRNHDEARRLGFEGTPSFVIGTAAVSGAPSASQLQTLVDQAIGHN